MTSELDDERGLSMGTVRVHLMGLWCGMCGQQFPLGSYGHMLLFGPPEGEQQGFGLLLMCIKCYHHATAERLV